jgi:hypothetical protein
MIVLSSGVIVPGALAFKCLRFSGLACFRLLAGGGVFRIVYCVAFRCVIQVISLSSAAGAADEKTRKNGDFRHVPQTISLRDVAIGVKWEGGVSKLVRNVPMLNSLEVSLFLSYC